MGRPIGQEFLRQQASLDSVTQPLATVRAGELVTEEQGGR